jgi:predicted alpha/beta superfamily hydrolase
MKPALRTIILMIGFILIQFINACAQTAPVPSGPTVNSNVTIPYTEMRQLDSPATGRSYAIYIRLPDDYVQDRSKSYPVLYVLDAQWDFKMLDSIYGGLLHDGYIPEMIIVGIAYAGDNPDYAALRSMDFTPVQDVFLKGSGDAPKFYAFLTEQLIPFVETNYRAVPSQRVLMGGSFSALFTLYAMFTRPTFFNGYIASSPIVTYGNRFSFKQEAEYASEHKDLPVRLFVGVGGEKDVTKPVEEFLNILEKRNYASLEMETRIIEGEGHASNKPETYNRGLRFVFQKK